MKTKTQYGTSNFQLHWQVEAIKLPLLLLNPLLSLLQDETQETFWEAQWETQIYTCN